MPAPVVLRKGQWNSVQMPRAMELAFAISILSMRGSVVGLKKIVSFLFARTETVFRILNCAKIRSNARPIDVERFNVLMRP
jgi:hypothetical protein